jgi:hypothetical protein
VHVARKKRLGDWLAKIDVEINKNRGVTTLDKSKMLFDAVVGHRLKEANEIAREAGELHLYWRLFTLIS